MKPDTRTLLLDRLFRTVIAGLITGTIIIIVELAFAPLIFAGPLAPYVGSGIGFLLFGATVMSVVVAFSGSFAGTLAGPQDSPVAILALIASAVAASMWSAAPDVIFSTVCAVIALTSLLTGILFLSLGRLRLGGLVRFAPYPVIGGFLAGTGWLLLLGAMNVMTGLPLSFSTLVDMLQPELLVRWLPGAVFGIALLIALRRLSHFLVMPVMLVIAVAIFYGTMLLGGIPLDQAASSGWLLGPLPQGPLWQPISPNLLGQVDWSVFFQQIDKIGAVLIIALLSLLLNSSGLELAVKQDLDLNRELKAAGAANLIAGLGGSAVGYHLLSPTVLSFKMGVRGRVAALVAAVLCASVLLFGASLAALFPRPVLGGLLFFIGLAFLVEWVYDAWFRLARTDYALVLAILAVVVAIGFLQGVAAGIAIAIGLFVVNSSRLNVIRHTLTGSSFHSTVDRPPSERQYLREHGEQLWILQLQGYIFFGTAQRLLDRIRRRVTGPLHTGIHYIILDLARVDGLDASAASCFIKLEQFVQARKIVLILTHLSSEIECQLEQAGLGREHPRGLEVFPSLDLGVEWVEDQVLKTRDARRDEPQDNLLAQLSQTFSTPDALSRFMMYLDKLEVGCGDLVLRQGDPADALYLLASGTTAAQFQSGDGRLVRLRTMRCGTIIGDVGLYTGQLRTATVRALEPSVLYRLSIKSIRQMEECDPDLAALLHGWTARLMAERLAENNNLLAAITD